MPLFVPTMSCPRLGQVLAEKSAEPEELVDKENQMKRSSGRGRWTIESLYEARLSNKVAVFL